jgi:hypothetical protein
MTIQAFKVIASWQSGTPSSWKNCHLNSVSCHTRVIPSGPEICVLNEHILTWRYKEESRKLWPPRSYSVMCSYVTIWSHVNRLVYIHKFNDTGDLKWRIVTWSIPHNQLLHSGCYITWKTKGTCDNAECGTQTNSGGKKRHLHSSSFDLWHHLWATDILEEHTATIIRLKHRGCKNVSGTVTIYLVTNNNTQNHDIKLHHCKNSCRLYFVLLLYSLDIFVQSIKDWKQRNLLTDIYVLIFSLLGDISKCL